MLFHLSNPIAPQGKPQTNNDKELLMASVPKAFTSSQGTVTTPTTVQFNTIAQQNSDTLAILMNISSIVALATGTVNVGNLMTGLRMYTGTSVAHSPTPFLNSANTTVDYLAALCAMRNKSAESASTATVIDQKAVTAGTTYYYFAAFPFDLPAGNYYAEVDFAAAGTLAGGTAASAYTPQIAVVPVATGFNAAAHLDQMEIITKTVQDFFTNAYTEIMILNSGNELSAYLTLTLDELETAPAIVQLEALFNSRAQGLTAASAAVLGGNAYVPGIVDPLHTNAPTSLYGLYKSFAAPQSCHVVSSAAQTWIIAGVLPS